ncbi:branched chain amino acid aminotransferase [soil metagenome]
MRIAMWSGPRNISTAMMRAWENRTDTLVVDEPFYACYLQATGLDHPGAAEVIAAGETKRENVVMRLLAPPPAGKQIIYQKQMTHHLLPEISRDWLGEVTNCFLIRDPREVITSYIRKNRDPAPEDVGYPQQVEIFEWVRAHTGGTPPVIDARDVLENPERVLRLLCEALGVEFSARMLSWPPGLRESDGVWAKHWYAEVANSTGFRSYAKKDEEVPSRLRGVYEECRALYEQLHPFRLH